MYEKITNLKKKLQDMKKSRLQTVYNQIFKFKPFSKKQKQVLTWWCATSPVKDYDPNEFQTKLINSNRYVSSDYGTQNATVFLLWNKGTDGVWYCTREYYYSGRDKGRQKTDAEYANDLESWLDGTEIKAVIVDPAAASFIAELRKRGFRVIKAKNDVEDGIRLVSTKLNLIKIIFSNVCQNTIKEFASYIWDAKAAERGEDKPIKQYDHAMDAVRYFVYTIFGDKPRLNRNLKGGL